MRITAGKETVIVRGMRPEENWWGKYQFPCPYRLKDKIAVSVHVEDDTIITTGSPARWFESSDGVLKLGLKCHRPMQRNAVFYSRTATESTSLLRAEQM